MLKTNIPNLLFVPDPNQGSAVALTLPPQVPGQTLAEFQAAAAALAVAHAAANFVTPPSPLADPHPLTVGSAPNGMVPFPNGDGKPAQTVGFNQVVEASLLPGMAIPSSPLPAITTAPADPLPVSSPTPASTTDTTTVSTTKTVSTSPPTAPGDLSPSQMQTAVQKLAHDANTALPSLERALADVKGRNFGAAVQDVEDVIKSAEPIVDDVKLIYPTVKSGWKSSELWINLLAGAGLFVPAFTGHPLPTAVTVTIGALAGVYNLSRAFMKKGTVPAVPTTS